MGSVNPEIAAIAHSDVPRPRRPWLSTVSAILAACVVVFILMTAAVAFVDVRSGGPGAREASKQSRLNGENLCEFAVAVSDVLVVLADSTPLTPDQQAALDKMELVADRCQSAPE